MCCWRGLLSVESVPSTARTVLKPDIFPCWSFVWIERSTFSIFPRFPAFFGFSFNWFSIFRALGSLLLFLPIFSVVDRTALTSFNFFLRCFFGSYGSFFSFFFLPVGSSEIMNFFPFSSTPSKIRLPFSIHDFDKNIIISTLDSSIIESIVCETEERGLSCSVIYILTQKEELI